MVNDSCILEGRMWETVFLQNRHSLSIHEIRAFLRVFGKITVLENMAPVPMPELY